MMIPLVSFIGFNGSVLYDSYMNFNRKKSASRVHVLILPFFMGTSWLGTATLDDWRTGRLVMPERGVKGYQKDGGDGQME